MDIMLGINYSALNTKFVILGISLIYSYTFAAGMYLLFSLPFICLVMFKWVYHGFSFFYFSCDVYTIMMIFSYGFLVDFISRISMYNVKGEHGGALNFIINLKSEKTTLKDQNTCYSNWSV